ncbi:peptidoglycan recognition protein family protein [Candidatus Solirubrobacter pratensis]|uniref:peptidoglycan recognition protein family protein n=1 Tax=Candidatus Solirubrobacter pratensis TaxID=1298857 RepID=UPI0012DD8D05|nr:peptidoglycan recognition protein [Candidatus Solirubrobacter pratensis]
MAGRNLTRRDALRLGAGAVAVSALRVSPARAAAPPLFELPLPDRGAHASSAWHTTAVLRAPRRFDLVGLTWAGGASIQGQVRARRRSGRWTAWLPLPRLDGHAPDGGAAPAGTDPAFTGAADELQFRLRGSASRLTAKLVHALGEAPRVRPHAQAAQVGQPPVIPRASWGADAVPPRAAPEYGVVEAAFVHHTVGTNDYAPSDSAAIVLGIARYHRDTNGWNDIGYNFLVDKYGQIFEGRAGGIEAAVVGAQAQGYNAQSTGIACLGTFSAVTQSEAGLQALAKLIGWKLSLHAVPVTGQVTLTSAGGPSNRYASGTPVTVNRICGHRDGDSTSCPGDVLYGQLADLRSRAARFAGPVSGIVVRAASRQHGTTPVSLNGVLHFADGSSPSGAPLSVEFTAVGSAWTQVATTICGPDGTWAANPVLPSSGKVRAVFAGDGSRPKVESGAITVQVVPKMSLSVDKRRARAGSTFAVSGTMSPAQARVTCLLERQVGRRWATVQRKRVPVRNGAYATSVRPSKAGLYRVSIMADGVTRRKTLRATRA